MEQPPEKTELGLRPRLIGAGWFAATACIPVFGFLGVFGRLMFGMPSDGTAPVGLSIFVALPLCLAAFFGFVFGSTILNDAKVAGGWKAAWHGARVGLLSYVAYVLFYAIIMAANAKAGIAELAAAVFTIFFFSALFVGWLIPIAGALGGWLLFRFSWTSLSASNTTWTSESHARRLNQRAVLALIAALIVCWLPVRNLNQREAARESQRDLFDAVWRGQPERVDELLASGMSANMLDVGGTPLLVTAAEKGHTRVLKILLAHGADPNVRGVHPGRETPLHLSASNFDIESIRALLERGADVNARDDFGRTPLLLAAAATDRDTVKYLIDHGADINCRANDGRTPLSNATVNRDSAGNLDRSGDAPGQRPDAGENYGDSRDYENPLIIKRARARHDGIIDLLKSSGAKSP